MDLEFRILEIKRREAAEIAAIDQAIFEEVEAKRSPPTLIYYDWEKSISLAKHQPLSDINMQACKNQGFSLARMQSGGKAVIHIPGTEFSYSLFVPYKDNQKIDIQKIYETYCGKIVQTLNQFNIADAKVTGNDIYVGEKKIGGNAQRVGKQSTMQHGLILYEKPSAELMLALINKDLYPDYNKAEQELNELLTGVSIYTNTPQQTFREALTKEFTDNNYHVGTLTQAEEQRVKELIPHYQNIQEINNTQARGLCWYPAPEYLEKK